MVMNAMMGSPWTVAEPSLGKAIHVMRQFACDPSVGATYGDDTRLPRSDREIRRCTSNSSSSRCLRRRSALTAAPAVRKFLVFQRAHVRYGTPLKKCSAPNTIACFCDSKLHFHAFFEVFDSTPSGIDLPKFEEWLPTKELQRLHIGESHAGRKTSLVPNRLLAALPRKDYQKLLPVLEPVKLAFEEVLYEAHAPIRHVYFPNDCFVSMLTTVDTGRAAEVGLIGSEGMVGSSGVGRSLFPPFRAVGTRRGGAMRMTTGTFAVTSATAFRYRRRFLSHTC